jgi:hypothetical protein
MALKVRLDGKRCGLVSLKRGIVVVFVGYENAINLGLMMVRLLKF